MELFCEYYLKPLTIFAKASFWIYDCVLNTPLEGFVQDVPREQLSIAPVVDCLRTTAWQIYHQ